MTALIKEYPTKTYTHRQKLTLKDDIEKKLEQKELLEILKILVENDIKLSQNYTGVLFDLKYVPNSVLTQIEKYIMFCSVNRKNQLENDNLKLVYKKKLKPETYNYKNTLEENTQPLSNLYHKYTNIENQCDTKNIHTYNVQNDTSMYKVNVIISSQKKSDKKNEYKNKLLKFNNIVNDKTSGSIEVDIDDIPEDIDDENDINDINDETNDIILEQGEYEEEGDDDEGDEF